MGDRAGADSSPLGPRRTATHTAFLAERPAGADEDVHMLAAIVDHVIERLTEPGDTVLDPFAGYGTTIERAVALGRRAIGIELLPERVAHMRQRTASARLIEGDARELVRLLELDPAKPDAGINLVLTSPPYMTATDHDADPLTAYERDGGDYRRYLMELGFVAAQCARVVVPGGHVVWNVADIHHADHTTPLIRDCWRVLGQQLTPVGITEIVWDRYPHDLIADALLVLRREPA